MSTTAQIDSTSLDTSTANDTDVSTSELAGAPIWFTNPGNNDPVTPACYIWQDEDGTFNLYMVGPQDGPSNGYHYEIGISSNSTKNRPAFLNVSRPRANSKDPFEVEGNSLSSTGWVGPHLDGLTFEVDDNTTELVIWVVAKDNAVNSLRLGADATVVPGTKVAVELQ